MWTVKAFRYRPQYPYIRSIRGYACLPAGRVSDRVVHAETSIKKKILGARH